MDVYRAFGSLRGGQETDPLPLDEESPVRESRYPYPDAQPNYDKLDVEDIYGPAGACVLRLPMVYGEREKLRRQEWVLRRIRAGRRRMPIREGATWLTCREYLRDVARAMRMAMEGRLAGVYNVCDARSYSVRMWARLIADAAGADMEFVRVPDRVLPPTSRRTT
jgi:nucleoside-diphosphate-sugar epimerase